MAGVADIDPAPPSIARVYDYLLNGKGDPAVTVVGGARLPADGFLLHFFAPDAARPRA